MSDDTLKIDDPIMGLSLPRVIPNAKVNHLNWGEERVHIVFPHHAARPGGFKNKPFSHEIVLPINFYLSLCQVAILSCKGQHKEYKDMAVGLMFVGIFSEKGDVNYFDQERMEALYMHMVLVAAWQQWESVTDPMLALSYTMLADRHVTREKAFRIAEYHLRHNPPKSSNSWRVRVDKYAKDRGLPPIGQPIRKPRQESAKI